MQATDPKTGAVTWLYVPLPKQCAFEEARRPSASDGSAFHVLYGGAAGPGKSHGARWSLYRKALLYPGYEGLLVRKTFPELEKTHLRAMGRESTLLQHCGVDCKFVASDKIMKFGNGSLIECGHMDDAAALDKYLSTEYDDIVPDEASLFLPGPLLELSTRARSSKPNVLAAGGPWFRPVTNPGGPASRMLLDFFIDHTPAFDDFPPEFKAHYDPTMWVYIEGTLDDNPYLGPGYEATLSVAGPTRFRQLRYADWRVFSGQFFTTWRETLDGQPWHVQDVKFRGSDVSWFRSMDWGRSNPGCVQWWACLPDGHLHIAAELKFVDTDVADVVEAVKIIDNELGVQHVRYTVSDPALHNRSQETGESIAETFARCGMPLLRGNNNRVLGWERLRNLLRPAPDVLHPDGSIKERGQPWLTVAPRCRYGIRTMPLMQQDKSNPEDIDTDMDDHWCDTARYAGMSRPAPHRFSTPTYPKHSVGAALEELRALAGVE